MSTPKAIRITLPPNVVAAIERYNTWDDSQDPSKLGALNAVSWIGEQVAALVKARHVARDLTALAVPVRGFDVCAGCGNRECFNVCCHPSNKLRASKQS